MSRLFNRNKAQYVRKLTDTILSLNSKFCFGDELGNTNIATTGIHDLAEFTVIEPLQKRVIFQLGTERFGIKFTTNAPQRVIATIKLSYQYESSNVPCLAEVTIHGEDIETTGTEIAKVIWQLELVD